MAEMTRPALQLRANTLIQCDNHIEPGSMPCQLENAVQDLSPGGQCPKMPPVGFTNFWLFYKLLIQTGTHWLILPLPLLYLDIFQFHGTGWESRCVYTSFVLSFKKANSVESCPAKKGKEQIMHITLLSCMIPKIFRFFKMLGGLLPLLPLKIQKD